MGVERPALLWLLPIALALPYVLGRIRARRIAVVVGTHLLFARALEILAERRRAADPRAAERRRPVDPRLLLETAALALLALAAAGPSLEGAEPALRVGVALDDSPSMGAAGRAEQAALLLERVRPLGGDGAALEAGGAGGARGLRVRTTEAPEGAADALAWAVAALRASGVDAVLAVTDRPPGEAAGGSRREGAGARSGDGSGGGAVADATLSPDLTVVCAGNGAPNVGIVAAGAREGEWLARMRVGESETVLGTRWRGGAGAVPGVREEERAGAERIVRGGGLEARGAGGDGSLEVALSLESGAPDALAADDLVLLLPPGARPLVRVLSDVEVPALRRAIEAAGARALFSAESATATAGGSGPPPSALIALAREPGAGPPPRALFAPEHPASRRADLASIAVHLAPAAPGDVPLARGAGAPALRPLLHDERGRTIVGIGTADLAALEGRGGAPRDGGAGARGEGRDGPLPLLWIGIPLARGERATDLMTRRVFPILVAGWLEWAGALAEPGAWSAQGLLSPRETEEAGPLGAEALARLLAPDGAPTALARAARVVVLPPAGGAGPGAAPSGDALERALDAATGAIASAARASPARAARAGAARRPLAGALILLAALAAAATWALSRRG